MKYEITDFYGRALSVSPRLGLYSVEDYMGNKLPGIAVILDDVTDPSEPELYAVLTVSFGEFIGMKNCAYIDTNNCDFAQQLLDKGLASDTGFYKASGFCQYPLWQFEEGTLREIDNEVYQKYSDAYDGYMASMYNNEQDEDGIQEMTL
jgi:hypothetical protein